MTVALVRSAWTWVSILAVVVLSLHVFGFGLESRIPDYLRNALHAPTFALLAIFLQRVLRRRLGRRWSYPGAAGVAVLIGILGELAQLAGSREADFSDLAVDGLGILTGLAIRAPLDPSLRRVLGPALRAAVLALGLAGSAAVAYPFARYAQVARERAAALPVLLSFEEEWERVLYTSSARSGPVKRAAPPGWPAAGRWVAEMVLDRPRQPGLKLFDPYPDWSGYHGLSFVAATEGDAPEEIVVRVHDDDHDYTRADRFQTRLSVGPEPRRYRIDLDRIRQAPAGRELDLSRIDAVIIYDPDPQGGERILIDDLRLEP